MCLPSDDPQGRSQVSPLRAFLLRCGGDQLLLRHLPNTLTTRTYIYTCQKRGGAGGPPHNTRAHTKDGVLQSVSHGDGHASADDHRLLHGFSGRKVELRRGQADQRPRGTGECSQQSRRRTGENSSDNKIGAQRGDVGEFKITKKHDTDFYRDLK